MYTCTESHKNKKVAHAHKVLRGKHPCHLCEAETLTEGTVFEHVLASHHQKLRLPEQPFGSSDLLEFIADFKLDVLPKFKSIFVSKILLQ